MEEERKVIEVIKVKKRVGRPSKQERVRIGRKGIIEAPENPVNVIEMVYDNPTLFEMIFAACKRISTDELNIGFEKDKAFFYISSEEKNDTKGEIVNIFMKIDFTCKNFVSYYCKENIYIKCNCKAFLDVIKTKKKDNTIKFSIVENVSFLELSFKKEQNKLEKIWRIKFDVIEKINCEKVENLVIEKENFPLSFCLNWPEFKGLISSWKKFKPTEIFIDKEEGKDNPLRFHFNDNEFKYDCNDVKLKFTGENIFCIKFDLKTLTSIASSEGLSNNLYFFLREKGAVITEAFVDEEYDSNKKPKEGTEAAVVRYSIFTKKVEKK